MNLADPFWQLLIAAGLGLLVGMQRERAPSRMAGLRTFSLITVLGWVTGLAGATIAGVALLTLGGIVVVARIQERDEVIKDPGITTEVAILVMFGVGVMLAVAEPRIAIAAGAATAALLAFKVELHQMAERVGDADLKAVMQFILLTLVILPALPDRTFGPYDVLNPRQIWWMVVLIVGIGMVGYIAHKMIPSHTGLAVGGVLGGLVSSTATTVSYARRSAEDAASSGGAAAVIVLAAAVVYLRVLVEIAVTAAGWLRDAALPLGLLGAVTAVGGAYAWWRSREGAARPPLENPSQLGPALLFAAGYAVILLVVAYVKDEFGDRGLYVVAAISGLTDVDAVTLSSGQLVNAGRLDPNVGWRIVMLATLSNLIGKAGFVAVLGSRELLWRILGPYAVTFAAGIGLIVFWP
jgi:uncharacterized membrane protein (DUF4010 family)